MKSNIPPFGEKPELKLPSAEDLHYIRKWLMERVVIQNLLDHMKAAPPSMVGWDGQRVTIQG